MDYEYRVSSLASKIRRFALIFDVIGWFTIALAFVLAFVLVYISLEAQYATTATLQDPAVGELGALLGITLPDAQQAGEAVLLYGLLRTVGVVVAVGFGAVSPWLLAALLRAVALHIEGMSMLVTIASARAESAGEYPRIAPDAPAFHVPASHRDSLYAPPRR